MPKISQNCDPLRDWDPEKDPLHRTKEQARQDAIEQCEMMFCRFSHYVKLIGPARLFLQTETGTPDPILRTKLDPLLALWARQLFDRVGNLIIPTLEQWELGVLRASQPQSKMAVWECIARAYEHFLAEHPDCDKAAVATDLFIASMFGTPNKELHRLHRITWNRMNGNVKAVRKEILRSLAHRGPPQLLFWEDVLPCNRQLLFWDDLGSLPSRPGEKAVN